MNNTPLLDFLRHTGSISLQKAEEIAGEFRWVEMKRGHHFLRSGTVADEYLFLQSGLMRAYATDPDGEEVTTAIYTARQVVFEVSSFFNRIPSRENIISVNESAGWTLNFASLNKLFHEMPEFRDFGRAVLVKGFSTLKSRMLATITNTADVRYQMLLKEMPDIFLEMPLMHIASYLGITDSSLSRIRRELGKK